MVLEAAASTSGGMLSLSPDVDRGEAETVMWLVLHPDKWNGQGHLAWRWHPDELESSAKR